MMTPKDCEILAKELDKKYSHKLNDYETRFISDIIDYMDDGGFLSNKQIKLLESIYEKATDI